MLLADKQVNSIVFICYKLVINKFILIHLESTKGWTGENQTILSDFKGGGTEASG